MREPPVDRRVAERRRGSKIVDPNGFFDIQDLVNSGSSRRHDTALPFIR